MQIVHLPPLLIPYLNTLVHPEADPSEALANFETTLEDMRAWWNFERSFSVDEVDAREVENLGALLEQIPAHLDLQPAKAQLEALVPAVYETVGLMEMIRRRRERAEYSRQPPVNDLILAGVAYLRGRGESRGVAERLARLEAYAKNLRQALRGMKVRLKAEVAESLQAGVEHLKAGLQTVQAALGSDNRAQLEEGLAMLREASEITQHFIDWERADAERMRQRHQRFCIPVVGPVLELNLDAAREFPKEQWHRALRSLRERTMPDLVQDRGPARVRVILPPEERAALLERVTAGVNQLWGAFDVMEDPEASAEEGIEAFESSLEELSAAFQEILEHSPPTAHLRDSQAGEYFELILGLLRNTVPLVAIPEMLHASPPPGPDWKPIVEPIMRFSLVGESEHLYTAALALLEKYPPPPETSAPTTWSCPFCGHSNPLENRTCFSCNSSSSTLEGSTWQA